VTDPVPSSRIPPLADPPESTRAILDKGLRWRGQPLNMPATLAHHPSLLQRFTVFAGGFLSRSLLPDRDRELLTLRAAARFGTEYYFGHHVLMSKAVGVTDEEIRGIVEDDHRWPPGDRVLLDLVDRLAVDTSVDDDLWGRLVAIYDEAQTMEAVMLVGFYRMLAGFVNSVGVQREDGLPGWPPPR
jgi:4-carboxymuconolactone decarboxylase